MGSVTTGRTYPLTRIVSRRVLYSFKFFSFRISESSSFLGLRFGVLKVTVSCVRPFRSDLYFEVSSQCSDALVDS